MNKILKKASFTNLWKATLILLLILFGGLGLAYYHVTVAVEQECNANLDIATDQFTKAVHNYFRRQTIQMQALAELIAKLPDIRDKQRVQELLIAFNKDRPVRHTRILYPDDTCLKDTGESFKLPFDEESKRGLHITNDMVPEMANGRRIVRIMAPVYQAGKTVAMVCSTIYLDDMQDYFKVDIYEGRAQIFIVDGNTGHYLLDNWHKNLNNNIGMLQEREYHPGYTGQEFLANLQQGQPGQTLFKSKTTGEYLYTHYKPIGINNWQGIVSVRESDAMRPAKATTRIMAILAVVYILAFAIFFGWISHLQRRTLKEWEQLWRLDLNTGLENRNAYIDLLNSFKPVSGQKLACVYVDVNGLHEMNNRYGHEAGDIMLNTVAAALQETFPQEPLYRLGGDEFLGIFKEDSEAVINTKLQMLKAKLAHKNYFVSVGVAYDENGQDLEQLVKAADKKMLEDKRAYYSTTGDRRRR